MFFSLFSSSSRQPTSPDAHLDEKQRKFARWAFIFTLSQSKQTNEQAVLLTITQKNSSELLMTLRWNGAWVYIACYLLALNEWLNL